MSPVPGILYSRVLPPEEWADKLAGTALYAMPLDPLRTIVVVVECDDQVVACTAILMVVHIDGLWVAESHRGHAGTARALVSAIVNELVRHHVVEVLSLAQTAESNELFKQAGGKIIPGTFWVIPVQQGEGG